MPELFIGKITKIDPPKECKNWRGQFKRVYFRVYKEDGTSFWSKCDVVNTFGNFRFWKDKLKVGNVLRIKIKTIREKPFVDTDFNPELIGHESEMESTEEITSLINQSSMF